MLKKILSVLMATVFTLGILTVAVSAADVEEPAYVPQEIKIEDIVAAIESGKDFYLNPTDVILLPVPDEPADDDEEEPEAQAEGEPDANAIANVLIVEYLPGDDASSGNKMTKFSDMQKSGYAVKKIGEYTDFAYQGTTRNTNYYIDYKNESGYAFKQWRVVSVYFGKEFSRVIVEAEWDVPVLTGWAGYQAMRRANIKIVIDYIIDYIIRLFGRIAAFLV